MSIEELKELCEKRSRGKSASSEHDLQATCVNWFRLKYPKYAKLLMAIPNGARRTKFERRMVLEEGLRTGTPDLFLAVARHGYHGLWIEMKNGKAGRVSDHQKEMMALLEQQGYKCVVCRNIDEFMEVVSNYLDD